MQLRCGFCQFLLGVGIGHDAATGPGTSLAAPDFRAADGHQILTVAGVIAPANRTGDDGLPIPPYKVYNIGNNHPENLLDFVQILSQELVAAGVLPQDYDFEAHKKLVPMQNGDVPITYADVSELEHDFGFKPSTSLRDGLRAFAQWYKGFYKA